MPRIVKSGFDGRYLVKTEKDQEVYGDFYLKSDTIEIKKGWRPEIINEIKNKSCPHNTCSIKVSRDYRECGRCTTQTAIQFEAGFDACIEAMENWK